MARFLRLIYFTQGLTKEGYVPGHHIDRHPGVKPKLELILQLNERILLRGPLGPLGSRKFGEQNGAVQTLGKNILSPHRHVFQRSPRVALRQIPEPVILVSLFRMKHQQETDLVPERIRHIQLAVDGGHEYTIVFILSMKADLRSS